MENPANPDLHQQLVNLGKDAKEHVENNVHPASVELGNDVDTGSKPEL